MSTSKSVLESKTVQFAAMGLLVTVVISIGVITEEEVQTAKDAIVAIVPHAMVLVSLAGTIWGRIKAKSFIK